MRTEDDDDDLYSKIVEQAKNISRLADEAKDRSVKVRLIGLAFGLLDVAEINAPACPGRIDDARGESPQMRNAIDRQFLDDKPARHSGHQSAAAAAPVDDRLGESAFDAEPPDVGNYRDIHRRENG